MKAKQILFLSFVSLSLSVASKITLSDSLLAKTLRAGVAKVDGTLPLGTPLAGYNHGQRRVPYWPVPEFQKYTTFMTGSTGVLNPTWIKALVLDDGVQQYAFVTFDGIGSDAGVNELAYIIAASKGLTIPEENIVFSSSHTHSGPGGVSADMLWNLAPATDLLVPELKRQLCESVASALIQAVGSLQPVKIDIGMGNLVGSTQNRRAGFSPYVTKGTIDPHLGVIRVDTLSGQPLATVWNFAIHGVCFGPDNLSFSSDIMGGVCDVIEQNIGGVALFINGDAGDIDPADGVCDGAPKFKGAPVIAAAVQKVHSSLNPSTTAQIKVFSQWVDFGPTDLNATLGRFDNCYTGGPLDVCTLCSVLDCDLNLHLYSSWLTNRPRFTAMSFVINNKKTVLVTVPGEALVELGWWIRNDTLDLGFDQTLISGYSNAHMGYFSTPNEYDIGGYESQLTFWGISTAENIRKGCKAVAQQVVV